MVFWRTGQERGQAERRCMNSPAAETGMAIWDVVVIGGGAAGLCAAAAVAGTGMSCLIIDRMGGGGELMNLGTLHDLNEPLTGPDLAARLLEDAVAAGAELEIGEATGLAREAGGWRVSTDDGLRDARAVILAIGLAPGTLGLDDEDDLPRPRPVVLRRLRRPAVSRAARGGSRRRPLGGPRGAGTGRHRLRGRDLSPRAAPNRQRMMASPFSPAASSRWKAHPAWRR